MLRFLPIGWLVLLIPFKGFSQTQDLARIDRNPGLAGNESVRQSISLFRVNENERPDKAVSLTLDREVLAWIWDREPAVLTLRLPVGPGKSENFRFERNQPLGPNWHLETSDGRKLYGKEYEGLHYRIIHPDIQIGGISFREDGLMAMIAHPDGNLNYGEISPGKGEYVLSNEKDMAFPGWDCGTHDEEIEQIVPSMMRQSTPGVTNACRVLTLYMEADYDFYKRAGNSLTTASNTINGFFNLVIQIYQAEGIPIKMSRLFVWTSTDSYATQTSSSSILYNFALNRASSTTESLGHFITTRLANMGGLGYLQGLCSPNLKFAFSNINYSYSALPNYSWTVYCISHEIGHNLGSNHTQWCGWVKSNGTTGRIDSCVAGEPSSQCGTAIRVRPGTVMSYCHLTSGRINFNLGFGPLPKAVILARYNAATCTSNGSCLGTASVTADSTSNKNNSYILTVSVPANSNATSWTLLEGSTVVQTGTLTGSTAFTRTVTMLGKANGTYSYTVRLANTGGTTTSSALSVTVAVPTPTTTNPNLGNCTATGLQAWFGTDGKMRFRFGLSPTCTTYNVQVCRYNLSDPAVTPPAGAVPVACGVRNGMSAYTPTAAERTAGFIERISDPQPSGATTAGFGSFWYSVDVICSGSGCTTTNRTRTYFFVPGF